MHLLYSQAIGTEIIDDVDHRIQGIVDDILIDPDKGKIVGLLVMVKVAPEQYLLQTQDILAWGKRIHVRSEDVLGPAEEFVRFQQLLSDERTIVGQRIQTEHKRYLGKCVDVQFNTERLNIEWIFPRKFIRRGIALPATDILEVIPEAIVVKSQRPREVIAEEEIKEATPEEEVEPVPQPIT